MTQSDMFINNRDLEPDNDALRAVQADFSPRGIPRQAVEFIHENILHLAPGMRVLCPNAGAGVYPSVLRRLEPGLVITAIELRDEEAGHLHRWCDRVIIDDALERVPRLRKKYDLIIDNPRFEQMPQLIGACLPRLKGHGALALLGLSTFGQAAEHWTGAGVWPGIARRPPAWRLAMTGRPKFRSGKNPETGAPWSSDSRDYCHHVWRAKSPEHTFHVHLPPLPAWARRWTQRPGTEDDAWLESFDARWSAWREFGDVA